MACTITGNSITVLDSASRLAVVRRYFDLYLLHPGCGEEHGHALVLAGQVQARTNLRHHRVRTLTQKLILVINHYKSSEKSIKIKYDSGEGAKQN